MGQEREPREATATPWSPTQADLDGWLSHVPGERIAGKYQLIRTLDQGGMGVIWVAHHLGLDIHVALKLVRHEVDSPQAAERLVLEAQAAARLQHPAIVHVLDVGWTEEGDPFLVMELLDGEPLCDVIDREGRLDVVTALRVMLPITGALGAMHAKGIIHRDIKPENIFLARDDAGRWQPKLIDFGLARLDDRTRAGRITQRGTVVGTPVYLSPERLRGEDADPRDDVWALCVALYVTVTGDFPFEGDNALDMFVALAGGEPRTLASHGIDDPGLWEIIRRGLQPRGARWASMAELGKALTRELLGRGATRDIAGHALLTVVGSAQTPGGGAASASVPPASSSVGAPQGPASGGADERSGSTLMGISDRPTFVSTGAASGEPSSAPVTPAASVPPSQAPRLPRPAWQVGTARIVRPRAIDIPTLRKAKPRISEAPTLPQITFPVAPEAHDAAARDVPASPLASVPAPPEPAAGTGEGRRLTPAIALGLVMLGVALGLAAGILIR